MHHVNVVFSMEVKYGNMFDTTVHRQDMRVAARGNATSFLMPWQSILAELRRQEEKEEAGGTRIDLPVSGEELRSVVQVLLKCNDSSKRKGLPQFIHQAHVRRDVVVRHIQDMKDRGHRAYVNVDMAKVVAKAKATLPQNGVPPEILRELPHDPHIAKLAVQKHATTVPEPTSDLEKIKEQLRTSVPNAVTMEKSSMDSIDYNNMLHNALDNLKQKIRKSGSVVEPEGSQSYFARVAGSSETGNTRLKNATVDIRQFFTAAAERDNILAPSAPFFELQDHVHVLCTCKSVFECNADWQEASLNCKLLFGVSPTECGKCVTNIANSMLDQFQPWYFGVAFAFCFKYCTGMPDLAMFGKRSRDRRKEDKPQVDLQLWSKIITRRCEKRHYRPLGI